MISDSRLIELQNLADRIARNAVPEGTPFSAYQRARDRELFALMNLESCYHPEVIANVLEADYIRVVND